MSQAPELRAWGDWTGCLAPCGTAIDNAAGPLAGVGQARLRPPGSTEGAWRSHSLPDPQLPHKQGPKVHGPVFRIKPGDGVWNWTVASSTDAA